MQAKNDAKKKNCCLKATDWLSGIWTKCLEKILMPEKWIISFKAERKENWDLFVLLLAFQNSLLIPIDLAFNPEFTRDVGVQIFDNIVDILFIIDMALMFMTSYLNKMGAEIFNSH